MIKAVIIGIAGPELAPEEISLLLRMRPAGVILFARNIAEPDNLRMLLVRLRAILPKEAVLMVDQEGGRVARLRPPYWQVHPSAGLIGELFARNPAKGLRAAFVTGALIGLDCADAGFDVACAPVLDLRLPGMSDVVGDRGLSAEPAEVARLARSFAAGLLAAGIQPVGKHTPGHGRALVDSHLALPVVRANDLGADLAPFATNADLPWMMTAHIVYPALDPELPATLSPTVIGGTIRTAAAFDGVLISDDLAMKALRGSPGELALKAVEAGCDLALYCPGDLAGNSAALEAVPMLSFEGIARLRAAAAMAHARRIELNADALASERAALFA